MCEGQHRRLRRLGMMFIQISLSNPFEFINMSPRIFVYRAGSRVFAHVDHRKPLSSADQSFPRPANWDTIEWQ
jgi:hypothetical protein